MKRENFTLLPICLFIVCVILLVGCGKKPSQSSAVHLVTVRYGNPKEGGVEILLPSSASYQCSKNRTRIRFIWKDEQGNEYSFVVIIVKGYGDIVKFVEEGRSQRGWQLIGKTLFQTVYGYSGKLLVFQKGDQLTEWICFPFESYPGGVVIYWFSTKRQYYTNYKILHFLFKRIKLLHPILPKAKGSREEVS